MNVDRMRMAQVLTNLLNNAAKFTETGGSIWLEARTQDNFVEICVRDNGIGISARDLPKIFELFAQAENLLTRVHGGLGIGLSLVRTLIELHGGSVEAFSEGLGKGSEFRIRLPYVPEKTTVPATNHLETNGATSRRILIVDDNEDAAKSLGSKQQFP